MNIFYLSHDPDEAARWHNNRHLVKMLTEYAQILSTVNHLYGQAAPYRPTHARHPSVLWAAESLSHWRWLKQLAEALHREYQYRYGKLHKAGLVVETLLEPEMPDTGFHEPPQAMPDEYRHESAMEAYRTYYRLGKAHLGQWKLRDVPEWFGPAPEASVQPLTEELLAESLKEPIIEPAKKARSLASKRAPKQPAK